MTTTASELLNVFPVDTRVNERGHLEIGGCDALELVEEFGSPVYVVAEADLRARARSFRQALASRPLEDPDRPLPRRRLACGRGELLQQF